MVFLVVKGTVYPDEFLVERKVSDSLATPQPSTTDKVPASQNSAASASPAAESIVPAIAHILNSRHLLKLVLMSAHELATLYQQRPEGQSSDDGTTSASDLLQKYSARIEELQALLKDTKTAVKDSEFDGALTEVRAMTSALYPSLCTDADGTQAAIDRLYAQHEDPDLDEDTRLLVYHCRVIMDPAWKSNEMVNEAEAALWFCGKPMEATLAKYAGRNEKSKIIVKVAPRCGPAPSGEPRMRYEDQRALYNVMCQRREAYKQLEDSELRDRVVQQARGAVRLSAGSAGGPSTSVSAGAVGAEASSTTAPTLRTNALRPIYVHKEERDIPIT